MSTPDDVIREAYLQHLRGELTRKDLRHVVQFLERLNEAR